MQYFYKTKNAMQRYGDKACLLSSWSAGAIECGLLRRITMGVPAEIPDFVGTGYAESADAVGSI